MLYEQLLTTLKSLQDEMLQLVQKQSKSHYQDQFHPDLSPIGWHLGHCIYTESYWIKEQLFGKKTEDDELKWLYVPELSQKKTRTLKLPEQAELLQWARLTQSQNRSLLNQAVAENKQHHLFKDYYLLYFLIQHYAQHIETIYMGLIEIKLQNNDDLFTPMTITTDHRLQPVQIKAGTYGIGSQQSHHYDNERPAQTIQLKQYQIAKRPVSNYAFLGFINANGYLTAKYWSDEGWQWRNDNHVNHPHHWRQSSDKHWFGINHNGAYSLIGNVPVMGLSYHESIAYATWQNGRLPHEYEWEVACKKNLLEQTGLAWEWCQNRFHPYPGFSAYPYHGYSTSYFDDNHYVLKGGSDYTKNHIKRPSFRNYYHADKQHLFAGLRLAYD